MANASPQNNLPKAARRPILPAPIFLLICGICLLAVFQLFLVPRAPRPLKVERVSWRIAEARGFLSGAENQRAAFPPMIGIQTSALFDPAYSSSHSRRVWSAPLKFASRSLELEVAGRFRDLRLPVPQLELVNADNTIVYTASLPLRSKPPGAWAWSTYAFSLPPSLLLDAPLSIRMDVPPRTGADDAIAIRGRAVFPEPDSLRERAFQRLEAYPLLRMALPFLAAAFALLALLPLFFEAFASRSFGRLFCLLFLLIVGVHFRGAAFFHWDEWHVLARFREHGLSGVLYRHNEHFLPLFFALYFLETKIFGACYSFYLLLSLLVHALNSLLVMRILEKLLPRDGSGQKTGQKVVPLLGAAFAVSALHTENLHWAFEICLLLSETISYAVLYSVLSLAPGKRLSARPLILIAAGTAAVPLFFGSGFAFPGVLAAFLLFQTLVIPAEQENTGLLSRFKPPALQLLACAAGLIIPVLCYASHPEGAGHSVEQANPLGNIWESVKYLFVGTQLGSILRALGLYPSLALEVEKHAPPFLQTAFLGPQFSLAIFGLLLSGAFMLAAGIRASLPYWLLGQAYLALYLLLPALGRWQFGIDQSLALRYHSQMLPGVLILLLPFFVRYWGRTLFSVSLIWLSLQCMLGAGFPYFTDLGRQVRRAVQEAAVGGTADLAAGRPDPISPAISAADADRLLTWLKKGH